MKPSQTDLFRACAEVLEETLTPQPYGTLARLGLARLGYQPDAPEFRRMPERVREKMLQVGRYDSVYFRAPSCLGALRDWFRSSQPKLFANPKRADVVIPWSSECARAASEEFRNRRPYLLTKTSCDPKYRWKRAFDGFLIEEHVVSWIAEHWPTLHYLPVNYQQYRCHCDHDLRLLMGRRVYKVDVWGATDTYRPRFEWPRGGGKHPVDMHLAASRHGHDFVLHGYVYGPEVKDREFFFIEDCRPISLLEVRLNCFANGIDYFDLCRRFRAPAEKCSVGRSW